MLSRIPADKRKRVLAIRAVMTIFGGIILFFFLLLIGLLYWMHADAPLPPPARLIHPRAAAYCVLAIDRTAPLGRTLKKQTPDLLAAHSPSPVARLLKKGAANADCPLQVVISLVPGADAPEPLVAVSLGKYPGMFHLVRRTLERRSLNGKLPATILHHQQKAIFVSPTRRHFPVVSIVRCSVLRGQNPHAITSLIDRLLTEDAPLGPWPQPEALRLEFHEPSDCWGWAAHLLPLPVAAYFSPETADRIEHINNALVQAFPALNQARDFRFWGQSLTRGFHARIRFAPPTPQAGKKLARRLPLWLRQHGADAGIVASSAEYDPAAGHVTLTLRVKTTEP